MTSALSKVAGEMLPVSEVKAEEGRRLLRLAHTLGIDLMAPDDDQARAAYDWTLRLKWAAACDSFYLVLAEDLACELWTAACTMPRIRFGSGCWAGSRHRPMPPMVIRTMHRR